MGSVTTNEFMMTLTDLASFLGEDLSVLGARLRKAKKIKFVERRACVSSSDVRALLLQRGYRFRSRVISFQMLKGGVAKTTSAVNFAIRANMYGARVLALDLDQQGNLSYSLGVDDPDLPVWLDILENQTTIGDAIIPVSSNFHLLPSNLNNSVLDRVLLNGTRHIGRSVAQKLKPLRSQYDLIVIDTAPNLSAINTAVACASDLIVLPVNPDRFSFSGLAKTLEELEDIRREFQARFEVRILFTKYDAREGLSHEALKECHSLYADRLLQSFIRTSTEAKRTCAFDRASKIKEDYDLLTKELLGFTGI